MIRAKYLLQFIEHQEDVFFILEFPALVYRYISPSVISRGYTVEEVYEQPGIMYRYLSPEQMEYFKGLVRDSIGKGPLTVEYPIQTKSGETKWYRNTMMVFVEEDGTQLLVGIGKDITAKKMADLELQKLKSEYEDLYENAPVGYHSIDKDGNIVRINDTELKWLGYTREELLGQSIRKLYAPESQKTFDVKFKQLMEMGVAKDFRMQLARKDGSTFHCLLNASTIKDDQGKPVFTRSIFTDISELKIAEDKANRSKLALQAINEELSATNKRMEKLNFTKEILLKILSHDLRNPLETIKMISSLLDEKYDALDSGTILKYLDYIRKTSHQATNILDDMTGMFDLTNEIIFEMEIANIAPLIEEVITINSEKAAIKTISIQFHKKAEVEAFKVNIDQKWFIRAVDNIISNSLKFTKPGGEINISCRKEGDKVILTITDNGIGIPEQLKSILFKKSNVPSRAGTEGELGTGLGLSIVKQIIDLQEGEISFESTEGIGSSFEIKLPHAN